MRKIEVTLSDGKPLSVRRMSLFELDNVAPDLADPGPFFYPVELAGGTVEKAVYDIGDLSAAPKMPDGPRPEGDKKDGSWWAWHDYDLYSAALGHESRRTELAKKRLIAIARYIIDTCVEPKDWARVETVEDYDRIQRAAITPTVTYHDIETAVNVNFRATYNEKPLMEALQDLPERGGFFDTMRQMEMELMMKLGKDEVEYGMIPVADRARMIVADHLPGWMSSLAANEASANSGKK
jgi:hypothetical protein